MTVVAERRPFTADEFLVWEAQQALRHEYLAGDVFAMTGGTLDHNRLAGKAALTGFDLEGSPAAGSLVPVHLYWVYQGLAADEMVRRLEAEGIIVEAGHFMAHAILERYGVTQMARLSLHYLNTEEEIRRAVGLIRAMRQNAKEEDAACDR